MSRVHERWAVEESFRPERGFEAIDVAQKLSDIVHEARHEVGGGVGGAAEPRDNCRGTCSYGREGGKDATGRGEGWGKHGTYKGFVWLALDLHTKNRNSWPTSRGNEIQHAQVTFFDVHGEFSIIWERYATV